MRRRPKALVTGGAGFIGSSLVEALLTRRYTVRVVDNYLRGSPANLVFHKAIRRESLSVDSGDLTDFTVARRAVRGVDVVFDLAAQVFGIRDLHDAPADLLFNNLAIVRNVAKASLAERARVIYASSSCIYDFQDARVPHDEDQEGLPFTYYGWSKLIGEKIYAACIEQARAYSCCVARLFNTYGPRESLSSPHVIPEFICKAFLCREGCKTFEILGNGQQTRAFTYVDDIVNGLIMLAESDLQNETVNLGSSEETRVFDLANMILRLVGVDIRRVGFVFRPAHPLDVQKRSASIEKARKLLGWKPRIDLQTGLRKTIDWFNKARSKQIESVAQGKCQRKRA